MGGTGTRSAWLLVAALVITSPWVDGANADPSEACRNLALQFGSQPSGLDMESLAALSTCVTQEIQARAASPGATTSSGPQSTDSTARGASVSQTQGTWGTWPTTPAWKDQEIESKPWDRWDK